MGKWVAGRGCKGGEKGEGRGVWIGNCFQRKSGQIWRCPNEGIQLQKGKKNDMERAQERVNMPEDQTGGKGGFPRFSFGK